jgi:hypothetical protein
VSVVTRSFCARCAAYREANEIKRVTGGRATVDACAICGEVLSRESQRVAPELAPELARALVYPFSAVGGLSLIGTFVLSTLASFIPLIGGLLSAALVVAFCFLVLRSTAAGEDGLTSHDDLSQDFWSWLSPLARYVLTMLVASAPALTAWLLLGWPAARGLVLALALLGAVYAPAGIVVAAQAEGCLGPLNPTPGVRIIARIPGPYFLTLGFLIGSLLVGVILVYVANALAKLIALPLVPYLFGRLLALYAPTVMSRQLGILVREHGEVL